MQLCPCVSETDDRYPLTTPDHLSDKQYLPDAPSRYQPAQLQNGSSLRYPDSPARRKWVVCSNCVTKDSAAVVDLLVSNGVTKRSEKMAALKKIFRRPTLRQSKLWQLRRFALGLFVNWKVFVSPLLLPYFYPTFTLLRTSL